MVQIEIEDETQSWRDLADQLPANMIAQLEHAEELQAAEATPGSCGQLGSDALMLHFSITTRIEEHQAGGRFAHVAVPDRVAHVDSWMNMGSKDEPDWGRRLEGPRFEVSAQLGHVLVEGFQQAVDGSVEWGLRVVGGVDDWMEASAARSLADAVRAAADAVESW